jgi:hypothetical protein
MKSKLHFLLGTVLLASIVFSVKIGKAQTGTRGLTISPFLLERQMQKGETSQEIIDITNTSDQVLPVVISVNDFYPQGDDGQPVFADAGKGDPRYSLSNWITIKNQPQQVLQPGEKTSVNFSITPPVNAEDGGHYGAILFSFQAQNAPGSSVAVAQKLGAIILIKLGKSVSGGEISSFKAEKGFYDKPPVTFLVKFNNTGNVHEKPRGGITVTNWFGKKVATTLVNENANNVLAQSERQFKSQWNQGFAFGRYTAQVELVYDDNGSIVTATTSFWVVPWKLILKIALGLFLFIVIFTLSMRKYNRYILKRAYDIQSLGSKKK